ncbi:MAG: HlyD family efflux transporter periplasmic adaptor subunit [Thiotrichales bacterium]|nr:HlyD family efflux transporter periplasmic adaptor subunit [Thiotrichales bacterium]MBT3612694.1 HlyD family efflux transporter periplasmic adaptor subunit [Thiotrichales bacterium]MBT3837542.1 HlyD family efflux transporter periplasmic adaptor subunit [Thiotrichales bacterium]MBT4152938.1 HlyD family efflux transporter periplasmic adaptor subunit [Thiotrichales bacterium]MBT4262344.1 HlyD family efflux transporter periplasmic adaptor subunit [Thiotrichales bacterium]
MHIKKYLNKTIPLLIIAVAIAAFMFMKLSKEQIAPLKPKEVVWRVESTIVQSGERSPKLILYGVTEAGRFSELKSALIADISNILVREGDVVERGAALIELDSRESSLILSQRKAELNEIGAKIEKEEIANRANQTLLKHEQDLLQLRLAELRRIKQLGKTSTVSQTLYDQAQQDLERQQIKVVERQHKIDSYLAQNRILLAQQERLQALHSQAKLDTAKSTLRAPYRSIIQNINHSIGTRLRPGDLVLSLYDPASIQLRVPIPNSALAAVRDGVNSGSAISVEGEVDGVLVEGRELRLSSKSMGRASGVDGVFLLQQNLSPTSVLLPGRALKLSLTLPPVADSITLPYSALYEQSGGNKIVYTLDDDSRLKPIAVKQLGWALHSGEYSSSNILIQSLTNPKLMDGDEVVTTHLPEASSGLKVKVESGAEL